MSSLPKLSEYLDPSSTSLTTGYPFVDDTLILLGAGPCQRLGSTLPHLFDCQSFDVEVLMVQVPVVLLEPEGIV